VEGPHPHAGRGGVETAQTDVTARAPWCIERCMSAPAALSDADVRTLTDAVRGAGTSFYWGMRRLPPDRRAAVFAVYAFCRVVDDIADDPGDPAEKRAALDAWRARIDAVERGAGDDAVTRGLVFARTAFAIRADDLRAVIAGMETDAADSVRIPDDAAFTLYIDRVACAVGRLCVRVFGVSEARGDALAKAQGEALQITNILRDVAEDAARGRVYIPADLLARHGVPDSVGPDALLDHPGLAAARTDLAERAARRFDEAQALIDAEPRAVTRPSRMMLAVYRATFERLRAAGWSDARRTVRLSKVEKALIALRYGLF
jgi:squalene synthase HpnD